MVESIPSAQLIVWLKNRVWQLEQERRKNPGREAYWDARMKEASDIRQLIEMWEP